MRFRFHFIGCTRGAIGIHYPIKAEAEGADLEAAKLALYDKYDHIRFAGGGGHVRLMFAATYVNKNGMRTLMRANQGHLHFETREVAKGWLDAVTTNNSRDNLISIWGAEAIETFAVREVECYDHGDAKGIYFDEEE